MTKKERIRSKILGFINPDEYIKIDKIKDLINPKKLEKYELKRTYYITTFKNLFNMDKSYGEMLFDLLDEEHFMFIYNNVLNLKDINNIKNRPDYCRDYRSCEELSIEMIIATIDEALTVIEFRQFNYDIAFNPNSTHTTNGALNGEPDLVVNRNGSLIYLEQQTVDKKNKVLILKYGKYKKLRELVKRGEITYLLTKYVDADTGKTEYNFTLMNDIVNNNLYTYVHNPKEEDTYYKQWKNFGKKAIIVLEKTVTYEPLVKEPV